MKFNRIVVVFCGTLVFLSSCKNDTNTAKTESSKEIAAEDNKLLLKVTDTFSVDGIDFQLLQNGDKAEINISAKGRVVKGNIKLSPPCYFLKRWDKVQSFAYPDVSVQHTLIVMGDTVGTDRKRYFSVEEKRGISKVCGEAIQGILIKKDSVIVSERVLDGGLACRDSGRDEKDFWDFAHNRETVKDARKLKYR